MDKEKSIRNLEDKKTEIIKCNKCGHVLIYGKGAVCFFAKGITIDCLKCGNKHVFGEERKEIEKK